LLAGVVGLIVLVNKAKAKAAPPDLTPTLSSIDLSSAATLIKIGDTEQITAIGTYSDGSTADLTHVVAWTSSQQLQATIDNTGLVHVLGIGNVTITAALGSIAAAVILTGELNQLPLPEPIPSATWLHYNGSVYEVMGNGDYGPYWQYELWPLIDGSLVGSAAITIKINKGSQFANGNLVSLA
jgi:Bacterial Ig-like domain (group 2)